MFKVFNFLYSKIFKADLNKIKKEETQKVDLITIDDYFELLNEDVMSLQIGSDLMEYVEKYFLTDLKKLRINVIKSTGFVIPLLRIKENSDIQENQYAIFIQGKKVFEDFVIPSKLNTTNEIIDNIKRLSFEHIDEVFTNEYCELYLKKVSINNPLLYNEITYKLSVSSIKKILISLLQSNISIKNISLIMEKISEEIVEDRYLIEKPEMLSNFIVNKLIKTI